MNLRLHSLFVPYDADQDKILRRAIEKRLGDHHRHLLDYRISRRAIDARHRPVCFVYSVDLTLKREISDPIPGSSTPKAPSCLAVSPGNKALGERPVVVGAGPAGLFAALLLSEHGYRPDLIDRGGTIDQRINALRSFSESREPDPENNALFGLGGAGTFSDGKLRTGVSHPWISDVLQVFVDCGAPEGILIDSKPHIGTDVLRGVVTNLVKRIEKHGGTVRTGVRLDAFSIRDGRLTGLDTSLGPLPCRAAVLAIGHSARDTWRMLEGKGIALTPKPFQIGIRVEHPQAWVDEKRYGRAGGDPRLGAADYKLATRVDDVPVFSFCMCPGGETMPTVSEPNRLTINGMSLSRRGSPFASSGMVVTLPPSVYGGGGVEETLRFQREVEARCFAAGGETYSAPAQRLTDFVAGRPSTALPPTSYRLGVRRASLHELLPRSIAQPLRRAIDRFNRKLTGYLQEEAVALAPESRASSPIRIERDAATLEANIGGVFPVGEGAGYAGGITSAALDGLNAARKIIETFAPPK